MESADDCSPAVRPIALSCFGSMVRPPMRRSARAFPKSRMPPYVLPTRRKLGWAVNKFLWVFTSLGLT